MHDRDLNKVKILTNHWGQNTSETWKSVSLFYEPPATNNVLTLLWYAIKLYKKRKNVDCVVLGAGRTDYLFALLQSLLPFERKPSVMIDCLWYVSPNKIKFFYKKILLKFVSKYIDKFVVWSSREVEAYSQAFGVAESKFTFLPYHVTITDIEPFDGGYIFSGGNYDRDYKTLIEAVKDLPIELRIACTRPENFSGIEIPKNVDVRGYTQKDYRKVMAGCSINIVSMQPGLLHSGGQQTYLNSMWYGKPTIVNDPEGAKDYIDDGVDGILVPPQDSMAIREAIKSLMQDPEKMDSIGRNAAKRSRNYTTEKHFRNIVHMIETQILPRN